METNEFVFFLFFKVEIKDSSWLGFYFEIFQTYSPGVYFSLSAVLLLLRYYFYFDKASKRGLWKHLYHGLKPDFSNFRANATCIGPEKT